MNDITPLEEAVLNAQDFAAGMAAMATLDEMLTKSKECRIKIVTGKHLYYTLLLR